jgi:hypothetical protein
MADDIHPDEYRDHLAQLLRGRRDRQAPELTRDKGTSPPAKARGPAAAILIGNAQRCLISVTPHSTEWNLLSNGRN